MFGEKTSRASLTNKQVLEIFNSNDSYIDISERYDVSKKVISQIKTGQNWSSVTGNGYIPKYKIRDDRSTICLCCGSKYESRNTKSKYCSYECYVSDMKKMDFYRLVLSPKKLTSKICKGCGKEFIPRRSSLLYCSKSCFNEHFEISEDKVKQWHQFRSDLIKKTKPTSYRTKESFSLQSLGKKRSQEVKDNLSRITKEQWEKGQFDKSLEERRKTPKRGKDHFNYKNGNGKLRAKLYHLHEYKDWRFGVFKRDKFTCQECGQVRVDLEVHHKIPFREIQAKHGFSNHIEAINCNELWDINNGITLCKKCHAETDSYRAKTIKKYKNVS